MSSKQPINHKSLQAILNSAGVRDKPVTALTKQGLMGFLRSTSLGKQGVPSEPFLVLDIGTLVSLMDRWDRVFPLIRPYYAVKCNPDLALISSLAAIGANFDCASRAEIELVMSLGVSASRIIFANPCKSESHILFAKSVGVNLTTFDSVYEVEKIRRLHPDCALLLRISVPDTGADFPLSSKYGALPCEVEPLLEAAKSAGLSVLGVSFHVGSGSDNPEAYQGGIALAKDAFDAAARLGLPKFTLLDIGGGFTSGPHFEAAGEAVESALELHFAGDPNLTVIAEPGRYFSESAVTFVVNVIGKRVRGELREYWISDGIYGVLCCMKWDKEMKPAPLAMASKPGNETCDGERSFPSTVFGPTCDSSDTLLNDYPLPELEVDDWLVFDKIGAYSTACGSNFNGFMASEIPILCVYSDVGGLTTSFEEHFDDSTGNDPFLSALKKKKVLVGDHGVAMEAYHKALCPAWRGL